MNEPEKIFKAAEQPSGVSNFFEPTLFGQDPFSNPVGNAFMTPPKKGNGTTNQAAGAPAPRVHAPAGRSPLSSRFVRPVPWGPLCAPCLSSHALSHTCDEAPHPRCT